MAKRKDRRLKAEKSALETQAAALIDAEKFSALAPTEFDNPNDLPRADP